MNFITSLRTRSSGEQWELYIILHQKECENYVS